MPKVKRNSFPKHIVVVDTNILWDEDKAHPVSPAFDKFWQENIELIPLELVVPEIVIGELNFQQSTSALKLAKNIAENVEKISNITKRNYQNKINENDIKKNITQKIDSWLKNIKGTAAQVPISEINWQNLINSAVWRIPPFSSDQKGKDAEKGFRDALILETFLKITKIHSTTQNNIVFVCNDFLLRTTAEEYSKNNRQCLFFESLEDFGSYIKLTQQKFTDSFIKDIQSHARKKFFTPKNGNCLYIKENITKIISERFQDKLLLPSSTSLFNLGPNQNKLEWKKSKWWVSSTQFNKLIKPKEFHWTTRVTLARLFNVSDESLNTLASLFTDQKKLQLINFDVNWKANVKADGRFYDTSITNIEFVDSVLSIASEGDIGRWKLDV